MGPVLVPENVQISAVLNCFYCLTVFVEPYGCQQYGLEQTSEYHQDILARSLAP